MEKEEISHNLFFQRKVPYAKTDLDDLRYFKSSSAKDVLCQLGSISKKEFDYYNNL